MPLCFCLQSDVAFEGLNAGMLDCNKSIAKRARQLHRGRMPPPFRGLKILSYAAGTRLKMTNNSVTTFAFVERIVARHP